MKSIKLFPGMNLNWFVMAAAVFCITVAAEASAQQKPGPCAEDAAKLCKGVKQGEGRMVQCLKQHENELSSGCKEQAAEVKEKIHDFASACKEDMKKLCAETKPGGGRLVQCLKQHEAELSAGCKQRMTQATSAK